MIALRRHALLTALAILAVVMLVPFAIVAMNAVKTPTDYSSHGPLAFPHELDFNALTTFWDRVGFGTKL
jgi:raffinose/stachyose/melibiose transport system permease protein